MVQALAANGADLILSARSADKLSRVADACRAVSSRNNIRVRTVPFDLASDPHAILKMAQAVADSANTADGLDRVDVLINNGGVGSRSSVMDSALATDIRVMNINFLATVALTKGVLTSMIERGSGNIVVVSSVQGKFGIPFRSSYAASKHALHGWFDALRAEVAEYVRPIKLSCLSW